MSKSSNNNKIIKFSSHYAATNANDKSFHLPHMTEMTIFISKKVDSIEDPALEEKHCKI